MKLIKEINALHELETLSAADSALSQIMANLDCGKFSYNYYPTDFQQTGKASHILCTEQVQGWQEHYSAHHYDQIDPIFNRMRKSHLPLSWKLEDEISHYDKNQKQFFSDAIEFGFRGGFAVPIHAPQGEFANLVVQDVAILKRIKQDSEIEHALQLVAYRYHAQVNHLIEKENARNIHKKLTLRETECLRLTAQHKTAKEIARILKITARTVGFHIENAIHKLGVENKYQAVSRATQCGFLR